jgi:small subunit ribosomal protein S2
LTNWRTIRQRIDYLLEIEKQQARGEFTRLPKKEALMREREIARLNHRLGGLKEMRRLPNVLFIVDIRRDTIAVKEANILGIPIIALVDTNCDPDPIDYVIPSNDDAIRALKLMNSTIANAVLEGQAILSTLRAEEEEAEGLQEEEAMERYLGPSTLAKLQAGAVRSVAWADDDEDYEDEDYAEDEGSGEDYSDEEEEAVTEPDVTLVAEEPYVSGPAEPVETTKTAEMSPQEEAVTEPDVTLVAEEPYVSQQSEAVAAAGIDEEPEEETIEEPVGEKNNV